MSAPAGGSDGARPPVSGTKLTGRSWRVVTWPCGSFSTSMSCCTAKRPPTGMTMRPPVVAVSDGKARLMLRRETIEDFLSLEVGS